MTVRHFRSAWIAVVLTLAGFAVLSSACGAGASPPVDVPSSTAGSSVETEMAIFAGGCFWCMEPPFDRVDGVLKTISGYTGGRVESPTYEEVSSGGTGHAEAVKVVFDPAKVSYERLLKVFWHNVDPLDAGGQFCDRGDQYRSEIFVQSAKQRRMAKASKKRVEKRFEQPVVTPITAASEFYRAEEYHQNFYLKNPRHYHRYRSGCGRDARLRELWGEAAAH